jgi:alpha-glucosidase (family GH31 glycosyl hydrolase)
VRRSQTISALMAVVLCLFITGTAAASPGRHPDPGARVSHDAKATILAVPPSAASPGFSVRIANDPLSITTARGGRTVLATASDGLRFLSNGAWQHATHVTGWTWHHGTLTIRSATTDPAATVEANITPGAGRYDLSWSVTGADPTQLGLAYGLASAGHWYGHGETETPNGGPYTDQPWPLDRGDVYDTGFGPSSYDMIDPFWYTSRASGLYVNTNDTMTVAINHGGDGLGQFTIQSGGTFDATVFAESTPLKVYRDYIGIIGKPAKSDATYAQYQKPLWNSWAQYYTGVNQQSLLSWAAGLHKANLPGHTIQLDDRWESEYGNLTFDPTKFPDPKAMSAKIHSMGYDFGLWVDLWINLDSTNYTYAADHGYLIKSRSDPSKPCTVTWWNGTAGIIDLANPAATAWFEGNLKTLMSTYGVDGFKFDTRFFDPSCAADKGYTPADYNRLGANLADQYDLQGAGIRVHWTQAAHQAGFVTRQVDKGTGWNSLAAAVSQNLAISTIGYPFVETDMIGGSDGDPPPTKQVLVRWAQAAALMPLMYSSTSPLGTTDTTTGKPVSYDQQTVNLYRTAINTHEKLAPYIWDQVQRSVKTGDPIMRPLFFDYPNDQATYNLTDEWMLGPAVLAAPQLTPATTRTITLPKGTWLDVNNNKIIQGPTTLTAYPTPLNTTPTFINPTAPNAQKAITALH